MQLTQGDGRGNQDASPDHRTDAQKVDLQLEDFGYRSHPQFLPASPSKRNCPTLWGTLQKAGDAKPLHPKTVAYWERQAALPDRAPHALKAIQDTLKAATGCATDNPRAALNEALDQLTPEARVQVAPQTIPAPP
jgi:hypothetical protein